MSCSQIRNLELTDVRDLIRNMLAGNCGDEDEDAILKILNCVNCDSIRFLLTQSGTSRQVLNHNIDGEQNDQLIDRLNFCRDHPNSP